MKGLVTTLTGTTAPQCYHLILVWEGWACKLYIYYMSTEQCGFTSIAYIMCPVGAFAA